MVDRWIPDLLDLSLKEIQVSWICYAKQISGLVKGTAHEEKSGCGREALWIEIHFKLEVNFSRILLENWEVVVERELLMQGESIIPPAAEHVRSKGDGAAAVNHEGFCVVLALVTLQSTKKEQWAAMCAQSSTVDMLRSCLLILTLYTGDNV